MNNKKILEELAFEKSKRDILKANQGTNDLKKKNEDIIENQDLTLGGNVNTPGSMNWSIIEKCVAKSASMFLVHFVAF